MPSESTHISKDIGTIGATSLGELVFEALGVGVAALDPEGRYVEVNDIWSKIVVPTKAPI